MFNAYFFRRPLLGVLCLTVALLAFLKHNGTLDRVSDDDPSHWNGERCAVTGIVCGQPDPRPNGCVYPINAETIDVFGTHERRSANGQILLQIMKSSAPIAVPGDRVRFLGRLQGPRAALIPGVFDYGDYLANHGIHSVVYTSSRSVENLGASGDNQLLRLGWNIKQRAVDAYERSLGDEQAAVLSGLTVGKRPRFHPDLKRAFVESGTMHVLVASGSNVAFVVALCFMLLRLVRVPFRWAFALSLPFVWMYVLVVGADAPIARAGVMGTIGIGALLLERQDRPLHALGLAALVLLALNPHALFDIGFQMSFVTVFGLIHFADFMKAKPWPVQLAGVTLTAQLWLIPITAAAFQRFFPIGLVANLIVVPLSGIGLSIGVLLALTKAAAPIADIYTRLLLALVRFFADHWGNGIWVAPPPASAIVGFYIACLAVVGVKKSVTYRGFFALGLLLIAAGYGPRLFENKKVSALTITWIDTGRKLSALVESPGSRLLIDPGPSEPYDTTERVLMPFFARNGIRSLDAVVLTRDADISSLLTWVRVSTVVRVNAGFIELSDGKTSAVFADVLKVRDQLLIQKADVIYAHFPRNWRWNDDFLQRVKPKLLVETNNVTDFRPTFPPWEDVPLIVPQKVGWYRWSSKD